MSGVVTGTPLAPENRAAAYAMWKAAQLQPYKEMEESRRITAEKPSYGGGLYTGTAAYTTQKLYEQGLQSWAKANPGRVPTRVTSFGRVLSSRRKSKDELGAEAARTSEEKADARAQRQEAIEYRKIEAGLEAERIKAQGEAKREAERAEWEALKDAQEKLGKMRTYVQEAGNGMELDEETMEFAMRVFMSDPTITPEIAGARYLKYMAAQETEGKATKKKPWTPPGR
jgi:hypothetical protein